MTVTLPQPPRGTVITPHLVRTGGDLVSTLGGPTLRITRVGSRYAADVQLPPLEADCAGLWLGAILEAEALGQTLSLPMPQMVVAARTMTQLWGHGSAGGNIIDMESIVSPPVGSWLSFYVNGRSYLHFVTGQPSPQQVQVGPLLRADLPNGTALQIATPLLEGFINDTSWDLEFFRFVGHKFTITESA